MSYFCFMVVELLCRYMKTGKPKLSDEEEGLLEAQRIIKQEEFNYEEELSKIKGTTEPAYEYGPLILHLKDVCTSNEVDPEHVLVSQYNGRSFVFKISWIKWKSLYQNLNGTVINNFTNTEHILV